MPSYKCILRWANGHVDERVISSPPGRAFVAVRTATSPAELIDFSAFGGGYDVFRCEEVTFARAGRGPNGEFVYDETTPPKDPA
jgi:hypothetical protein